MRIPQAIVDAYRHLRACCQSCGPGAWTSLFSPWPPNLRSLGQQCEYESTPCVSIEPLPLMSYAPHLARRLITGRNKASDTIKRLATQMHMRRDHTSPLVHNTDILEELCTLCMIVLVVNSIILVTPVSRNSALSLTSQHAWTCPTSGWLRAREASRHCTHMCGSCRVA